MTTDDTTTTTTQEGSEGENTATTQDDEDDVCPVCGQSYVHKREEGSSERVSLREDYVSCRTGHQFASIKPTVYVHETTVEKTETTRIINQIPDTSGSGSSRPGNLVIGDEAARPGLRATGTEIADRLDTDRIGRGPVTSVGTQGEGRDLNVDEDDYEEDDDLVPDGGTEDAGAIARKQTMSVKVRCPDCGATHHRPIRVDPSNPPETLEKKCIAAHPDRDAGFEGCGETVELEVLEVNEVSSA